MRDVESLKNLVKIFKGIEKFFTPEINVDKCETCWIGKAKYREEHPVDCTLRSLFSDPIKILVGYFCYDDYSRNLTLAGTITIFKTFMMSKAMYMSTTKTVPGNFLSELE